MAKIDTSGPRVNAVTKEDVERWLRVFSKPGQVTELRALHVSTYERRYPHTESGFFDSDHLDQMAEEAVRLSEEARGVYFTINPLKPEILHRSANRVRIAEQGDTAGDQHVLRRRWLPVDVDPHHEGVAGISATEAEKELAWRTLRKLRRYLRGLGWPEPILADSGNGYHVLYRIHLPAADHGIVAGCLKALAARFDSDAVKIDQSVFNPARIVKVPGTWARKGDDTTDRPHRQGRPL
jgi:hypothetical protein